MIIAVVISTVSEPSSYYDISAKNYQNQFTYVKLIATRRCGISKRYSICIYNVHISIFIDHLHLLSEISCNFCADIFPFSQYPFIFPSHIYFCPCLFLIFYPFIPQLFIHLPSPPCPSTLFSLLISSFPIQLISLCSPFSSIPTHTTHFLHPHLSSNISAHFSHSPFKRF